MQKSRRIDSMAPMIQQLSVGPIGENVYIIEQENSALIIVDHCADGKKSSKPPFPLWSEHAQP